MLSKGHKRKQQIIDTAKDMFIKNGFQSTHIGNVCEVLNIARGTVYQYFKNKREILYAVFDSVEEQIDDVLDHEELKDLLKKNASQKAILKLINDRIISCITPVINEPIAVKLIFRDIKGIDDGVVARVNKFIDFISKLVTADIDEMIKKGFCKKGVRGDVTAAMLIGGIFFVIHNYQKREDDTLNRDVIETLVGNHLKSTLKN